MLANLVGTPKRFCLAAIGTTDTLLYTAPSNGRSVIIDIMIANTTASAITLRLSIGATSTSTALGFYDYSVPANGTVQRYGFQVLDPSETLYAKASGTGLTISISGGERV